MSCAQGGTGDEICYIRLSCWFVRRFRPIEAADVTSQLSLRSLAVSNVADQCHHATTQSHNHVSRAAADSQVQVQPSTGANRHSRTLLLPSPSSAFSAPPARHNDAVPPTACRNSDADVPTRREPDSPDAECRYPRRRTVKEMAQSYDRATQQGDVPARRLSCTTFRTTLPSNNLSLIHI